MSYLTEDMIKPWKFPRLLHLATGMGAVYQMKPFLITWVKKIFGKQLEMLPNFMLLG